MRKIKIIMFLLIISLTLTFACSPSPSPQDLATGKKIETETRQNALDKNALRIQQEKEFNLKYQQQIATSQQWVESVNSIIKFTGWAVAIAIFALFLGLGKGSFEAIKGLGEAIALYTRSRAERIYMDVNTMSFPLFLFIWEREELPCLILMIILLLCIMQLYPEINKK